MSKTIGLFVALLLIGCATPRAERPQPAPAPAAADLQASLGGEIPDVPLTTQAGQSVHFYSDLVRGKVVVVQFLFTKCDGLCPGATANLVRVQDELGADFGRNVFFYSITLDPEHDTPEVLAEYAATMGAKPGWTFLTGRLEDIERLRTRLGIRDPDPAIDADRSQHLGVVVYGNDAKGRWAALPALISPQLITASLRLVMS